MGAWYHLIQGFGEHPADYARWGLAGHNGLDYVAKTGTWVLAAHAGIATVGDQGADGYGRYVKVICGYMETIYAHLSQVNVVDGQAVERGQRIGQVGSTGNSTGAHLHFGWRVAGVMNPAYLNYLDPTLGRRLYG
jgi:murein DD-endopeptidase MepM/ murein hydrolase activator NlpD